MEKIAAKNKICLILLLWMMTFLPLTYAQSEIDNARLMGILASLDTHVQKLYPDQRNRPFQGVTLYNRSQSMDGYNLLLSADAPEATLMDMNGNTVHQWYYSPASLGGKHQPLANFWMRAQILKNGGLLAMIPHGGILKIDKDSHLIWFKRIICHHDFDVDQDGNIYTLTIKASKSENKSDITIDSIAILSPDGNIKKQISLYDLFSGYPDPKYIKEINTLGQKRGFFTTSNGSKIYLAPPGDAFHSNAIQVLDGRWASKIPAFKKGNLLISVHHLGLIICVDPDQEKIVWLMDTTFWEKGQNFAKLLDNGNILLFDNHYNQHFSRVVEFDPASKRIIWDYTNSKKTFYSPIAGLCYRLPNGNTLITESTKGHSFEVNPDKKIVWEYYNPHPATIFQMQRILIDPALNWLNNESSDPFLHIIAEANEEAKWLPLKSPEQKDHPSATSNDLENLQSLSYLQGYNPPSSFKNVTVYDPHKAFNGYNLFVSAHAAEAVLMDMHGKTIHQWHYPSSSLGPDHRYLADYWDRVRLLPNGDLLAMIPYGGLLKLDRDSRLIWFRKMTCHHDLDTDSEGNIYTLTVKNSVPGGSTGMKIDSITILSADGEIKKEISLYELFKKYPDPVYINKINELGYPNNSFTSNNGVKLNIFISGDVFHSNSIQVLDGRWSSRMPAFKKGNVLISMRYLGVLICVDPKQEKIVWLMDTAFWNQGQHSAHLLDNGNILIFDNYYRSSLSRVVEFNPVTQKKVWDYSGEHGPFFSSIVGQAYRLPNGNTLITESTNGHSFEVTPDKKIVWEFYNPNQIDKDSHLLPPHVRTRFSNQNKKLIAITYQMQRIPIDDNLDWLKHE